MGYMIGIWTIDREGVSPGPGWAPGWFVPDLKYGVHPTNIEAKRAYLVVHCPNFSNLGAEKVKGMFHSLTKANSFSVQKAKVLRVEQSKTDSESDCPKRVAQPMPEKTIAGGRE
ncbi:MAG: hypothetical protein WCD18_05960 [Thermosynechococcaceae cyanobacterium]